MTGLTSASWEFFDSPTLDDSRLRREILGLKLSKRDLVRLDALMGRLADGRAIAQKDYKHLKAEELWELRFQAHRKQVRLLYSKEKRLGGERDILVLVGLAIVPKKSAKLPRNVFRMARDRRSIWRNTHL